ncbi:hypothetical protein DDE82_005910 [Stemphylium lycopersici]|uniref:H-type lectin domain-containing protein n=1 Tax=Stemphylium lycopersici TaxID=183478 RepID=A0A364N7E9_STELY|nr:hypothetical protein TW65_01668 [Stemphylium lycopersici]RAR02355.1 hypothetical protein DDE82_005910 [Stemphylium lycopersici]RAR13182.1 hypothetical protein DDE83_003437 [Stemphylium lycopersici]
MSLLLAPYNHAMRLGQGFNSYTQQICIDDAVIIDEQRPENVVTNDGTTMRIMAQKNALPSAWTRQKEVIVAKPATAILIENAEKAKEQAKLIEEELADEDAAAEVLNENPNLEDQQSAGEPREEVRPTDQPGPAKETNSANSDEPKLARAKKEKADAGSLKKKIAEKETLSDESASSDLEVVVADEALEAGAAVADEGKVNTPQFSSAEPRSKIADDKQSKQIHAEKSSNLKKDGGGVDQQAIVANLQQNASKDDEVDRDAIVANLQANTERPAPRKPTQRGTSADRARQISAKSSAGPPDRAAIRAALMGKAAPDSSIAAKEEAERARQQAEEAEILAENRRYQKELMQQQRKEEADRRIEELKEQQTIRAEKRAWDAQRREEARQAISKAADLKAMSKDEINKILAQNQFVERFSGMAENSQKYNFDPTTPRGPSQSVTYTTRFVDRLSDVTEDMSVSASLSIKAGKVGGSGKGSFVDSDKFKESDLNFYISVKVVNQTINFKDPLVYNPLRSVNKDNFREIYGDSFISGFVEGGEFNALVSMKILNKAKKSDIQAQAKVALTVGPVDVSGEASLGIARSNIETNTETTIMVNWSGGGHIKPMEQQWDIQSLMAAAARFPDLVADCPQRTYAILTKYDSLRSFVAKKPASYTALQYENAQIYTSTLLDSFVSYKSLYKRLGEQIFGVQGKLLEITPWSDDEQKKVLPYSTAVTRMGDKNKETGLYPFQESESKFEASIKGLSDARTAVRRQMARIVNEVDLMERDPKLATDEDHVEPYQTPVAFEARLPKIDVPEKLRIKGSPLSGKAIETKQLTEEEEQALAKEEEAFRKSYPAGDTSYVGQSFDNLDFVKSDWAVSAIRTEVANGALVYLAVKYANGLLVEKGKPSADKARVKIFGNFGSGERITSASIEHGAPRVPSSITSSTAKDTDKEESPTRLVLGLRLFTNRGRHLIARALHSQLEEKSGVVIRDGVAFEDVKIQYIDLPFSSGTLQGFFGRTDDQNGKIYQLGIIWCRLAETKASDDEVAFTDSGDVVDSEDLASLQKDQTEDSKALAALRQKLQATEQQLAKDQELFMRADSRIAEMEKEKSQRIWGAQHGGYLAETKGWSPGQNSFARCSVTFLKAYPETPKLLFGLSRVDAEGSLSRSLSLAAPEVNASGFSVQAASFDNCRGYSLGCNWMALPNDLHLETGMICCSGDRAEYVQQIFFSQSFASPPKIAVWFQEFQYPNGGFLSLRCKATDVTPHSFHLRIESWANRTFRQARVQYLAYPSEEDGKRVKAARTTVTRAQGPNGSRNQAPFYGQPFKNQPATFVAISEMDFNSSRNLRLACNANAPNNRELVWDLGTWSDSDMDHAECQWIAIE